MWVECYQKFSTRNQNDIDKIRISFSITEWNDFIVYLKNIVKEYFENDNHQENIFIELNSDEFIKLQTTSFMGLKIAKVTSTITINDNVPIRREKFTT